MKEAMAKYSLNREILISPQTTTKYNLLHIKKSLHFDKYFWCIGSVAKMIILEYTRMWRK